ncbi:MAG: amidohydrolase family protein [Lachnospiraceae bacterium]
MMQSVIRARKLYVGDGTAIDFPLVVLQDGIIQEILQDPKGDVFAKFQAAEKYDISETYLIPGLIDVHVHVMLPGDGREMEKILSEYKEGEIALLAWQNAQEALAHGITTLRDCGCAYGIAMQLRDLLQKEAWNGPDIVASGAPITSSCGHCHPMGGSADGAQEIVRKIRQQRKAGIDFCKAMADGGATQGGKSGMTFSQEELEIVVEEAHRLHMLVSMHATSMEAVEAAVDAGVDRIEHGWWINASGSSWYTNENLYQKISRQNIMICPTPAIMESSLRYYKQILNHKENSAIREAYESLKKYNDTGVPPDLCTSGRVSFDMIN